MLSASLTAIRLVRIMWITHQLINLEIEKMKAIYATD